MRRGGGLLLQGTIERIVASGPSRPTLLSPSSPVEVSVLLPNASIGSHRRTSAYLWQWQVETEGKLDRVFRWEFLRVMETVVGVGV
jgi:hypothetical protein